MTSAMPGGTAEGVPVTPVPSQSSAAARARHRASNILIRTLDRMFAWITKPSVREFLAELVGTFILIGVGDGAAASYVLKSKSVPVDTLAVCLCWGIGAMIAIIATGPISGGHINPAVTVAQAVLGNFSWRKVGHYLLGQYLGGFLASAVIYLNFYEGIGAFDRGHRSAYTSINATGGIWATYPAPFVSLSGALVDQVIGTGLLMYAVLAVGDQKGTKIPPWFQPIYMCLVITGLCTAYGLNCMAVLNPARDFAPRFFTTISGWGWEPFQPLGGHYWWIGGIVGPHIGAILGGWLYLITIDQSSLYSSPSVEDVDGAVSSVRNEKEHPLRNLPTGRDNPLGVKDLA